MAEIGVRTRMVVKDVMSSPVITINEGETIEKVAQLMTSGNLGCIIITGREDKPLGIITEKDLVTRVLAKNIRYGKVKVKKVMSTPLITIDPDVTLSEAARRMSRLNIRRFGVIYKGNLVGLVSSRDILAVTPELLETIEEKVRLEKENRVEDTEETPSSAGYCDQCGQWSDALKQNEGDFVCEECRDE